jgi:hypothetical protein
MFSAFVGNELVAVAHGRSAGHVSVVAVLLIAAQATDDALWQRAL